jgi:SAM-dependent methyltransferase
MLGFPATADYARALEVLQRVGYTEAGIGQTLGREQILTMPTTDVPRVLRRTRALSPLDTLIQLFFLGLPVPQAAVCRALHPMPLDSWVQAHLLDSPDREEHVSPRVQIWPVCGLMMAVDLPWRQPTAPAADFVVPPGPLTVELVQAMIHRPCSRMLDLGTGSGMLALAAAPDAQIVVATDTNERALAFTRFNARLNQLQNIHCLAGDLFDPVATQQFQLIVCNPPFVISPNRRYLFRDSGQRGDEFCRRLIRAAVEHLEPGGFLQCTANVPHQTGRSWKADLEAWFNDLGCDVLVLVERTEDASDYAMNWILGTETKDKALVGQRYQAWTEYLEREGIEAVSYLLITLRRSAAGTHWIQIDDPPCQIVGPCGDELLRFFEWRTALSAPDRIADLLSQRLRLAPGIRIEQEFLMTADGLTLEHVRLKKTGGLRYPLAIHVNVARLLAGCDGRHTLRELVEDLSRSLDADLDPTVAVALPVIRMLLERAVLVSATDDPPAHQRDA